MKYRSWYRPRRRRLTEIEQTQTRAARKMEELLVRLELIEKGDKVRIVRCRPGQLAEKRWRVVVRSRSISRRVQNCRWCE